ncbi:Hypothetical predicted protein [Pelobates cultripes]|uniref:Uncharacterized protein n=1 Tax=Pelobates cultripes TaxID=61616 RepID=A0AAD1R4V2_PELCU|nr:Hypothetical predicted protein [Pelobates cultripes]
MLQIRLTTYYIKETQKLVNRFMWDNKKPRVVASTLYTPSKKGVKGLTNLTTYYTAIKLNPLIMAFQIEATHTGGQDIASLMWTPQHLRQKYHHIMPTTSITLFIWYRTTKHTNHSISHAMPIKALATLIPDSNTTVWTSHSISFLPQMIHKHDLYSFEHLQNT